MASTLLKAGAMLLGACLALAAGAQPPHQVRGGKPGTAADQAELLRVLASSTAAYKDYMLMCAGCHRHDGAGVAARAVPSFRGSVGLLTRLPEGREYMMRVPGAAQSRLSNAELANVLNWMVATYSPGEVPPDFRPFTAGEVGAVRPYRYDDVVPVRARLDERLRTDGHQLSDYTFGK